MSLGGACFGHASDGHEQGPLVPRDLLRAFGDPVAAVVAIASSVEMAKDTAEEIAAAFHVTVAEMMVEAAKQVQAHADSRSGAPPNVGYCPVSRYLRKP